MEPRDVPGRSGSYVRGIYRSNGIHTFSYYRQHGFSLIDSMPSILGAPTAIRVCTFVSGGFFACAKRYATNFALCFERMPRAGRAAMARRVRLSAPGGDALFDIVSYARAGADRDRIFLLRRSPRSRAPCGTHPRPWSRFRVAEKIAARSRPISDICPGANSRSKPTTEKAPTGDAQ